MNEKRNGDRRIERTRHMLSDALFALIGERGYENITVQDITNRANVGRATFYLHYKDKEDLLSASLKDLVNELVQYVELNTSNTSTTSSPETYKTLSVRVFQHVAQHSALYHALLGETGPPMISIRMRGYLAVLIQNYVITPLIVRGKAEVDSGLLAAHAAGSLLALLVWWLDNNLVQTAEEMGALFWRLMTPGIVMMSEMPCTPCIGIATCATSGMKNNMPTKLYHLIGICLLGCRSLYSCKLACELA